MSNAAWWKGVASSLNLRLEVAGTTAGTSGSTWLLSMRNKYQKSAATLSEQRACCAMHMNMQTSRMCVCIPDGQLICHRIIALDEQADVRMCGCIPDGQLICYRGTALGCEVQHKQHCGGQMLQAGQRQLLHGIALCQRPIQQPWRVCHLQNLDR